MVLMILRDSLIPMDSSDHDYSSKITVIIVVLILNLLPRVLLFRVLFVLEVLFVVVAREVAVATGHHIFVLTGVTSGKYSLFLRLHPPVDQLPFALEGLDLILLLLLPEFFEVLPCLLQFLLLNPVVCLQFVFEVVHVPVLVDIGLLQLSQFLLQSFILLHEGWLDGDQVAVPLLVPLQFCTLFLKFFFQVLLFAFHVGDILHHFLSTFLLLPHNGSDAVFNVVLVGSVVDAAHPVQKLYGLLTNLPQFGLSGDGIVQSCTQIANLIGLRLVGLEIGDLGREGEGGCFLLFRGF